MNQGRAAGHLTLVVLVAVVLLSLLFIQWIYQYNADAGSLFSKSKPHEEEVNHHDDVEVKHLTEKMTEVLHQQSRTQELLLRLLSASSLSSLSHPPAPSAVHAELVELVKLKTGKADKKKEQDKPAEKEEKEKEKNISPAEKKKYEPAGYKRWLAHLGQSDLELECERNTGITLVERFREAGQDWCTSTAGKHDERERSGMRCYDLPGWGARRNTPDVICEGFNLVLDFEKIPWNPPAKFDSSGGNRQYAFQKGAFGAQCAINRSVLADDLKRIRENGNEEVFWKNFIELQSDVKCDVTIENPVAIVMRREAWNMYHMLCDWLNAFISLEVVGELDQNTQLLFLDMHEDTEPFTPLLKAFSPNHPLLIGKQFQGKGKVCLKHAVLPYQGYANFIHNNVWRASRGEPCVESQVIEAFSHFILNKMGMLEKSIPNEPSITLIVRKDYMGRRISRAFGNEAEIIKMLEDVTRGRGKLQVVQLESMSFTEQVELVYSKTNILIGAHGAGLSHLIFLPPEAIVIEVLPSAWRSFTYFRNLAKLSSKIYIPTIASGSEDRMQVDVGHLRTLVDVALTIANSFNTRIN